MAGTVSLNGTVLLFNAHHESVRVGLLSVCLDSSQVVVTTTYTGHKLCHPLQSHTTSTINNHIL